MVSAVRRSSAWAVAALAWSIAARAEPGDRAPEDARGPLYWPGADHRGASASAESRPAPEQRAVDRPFLYMIDPRLPAPLTMVGGYAASYSSTEAAARPLAASRGRSGLVNELELEVGALDRLSPFVTGWLAPPLEGEAAARGAFDAGLRVLLTAPESRLLRIAVDAGFLRDFADANGAFLQGTTTVDIGRLRLGGMVHAEKMVARRRDDIDAYAVLGASIRAIDHLRVGAEYVGQDLEEIGNAGAEGGVRQFAGGAVAWTGERFSISAGPALGLGGNAPSLLGRAQLAVLF